MLSEKKKGIRKYNALKSWATQDQDVRQMSFRLDIVNNLEKLIPTKVGIYWLFVKKSEICVVDLEHYENLQKRSHINNLFSTSSDVTFHLINLEFESIFPILCNLFLSKILIHLMKGF